MAKPVTKNYIKNRINHQINSGKIRIVNKSDFDGVEIKDVITKDEALNLKNLLGVDLIEITVNEKENSSICKLMSKDKFLYQEKKKEKERKANQKNAELKEIKFGVDIAENDVKTKFNHAKKFLEHGDNVKLTLQLRGRQAHLQSSKDRSMKLILEFAESLSEVGKLVSLPVWNNNRLTSQINSLIKK